MSIFNLIDTWIYQLIPFYISHKCHVTLTVDYLLLYRLKYDIACKIMYNRFSMNFECQNTANQFSIDSNDFG